MSLTVETVGGRSPRLGLGLEPLGGTIIGESRYILRFPIFVCPPLLGEAQSRPRGPITVDLYVTERLGLLPPQVLSVAPRSIPFGEKRVRGGTGSPTVGEGDETDGTKTKTTTLQSSPLLIQGISTPDRTS